MRNITTGPVPSLGGIERDGDWQSDARRLLANDVLDELNITVLPIVVGVGTRLFEKMPTTPVPLRLDGSQALGSGALELRYTPAVNPRLTLDSSSTYG